MRPKYNYDSSSIGQCHELQTFEKYPRLGKRGPFLERELGWEVAYTYNAGGI